MPVYELTENMTYEEFMCWIAYFEQRPVGWQADDRAFKLMQVQGYKGKPWSVFNTLNPIYNRKHYGNGLDIASLKNSVMFNKMLSAKGGDKLDFT